MIIKKYSEENIRKKESKSLVITSMFKKRTFKKEDNKKERKRFRKYEKEGEKLCRIALMMKKKTLKKG